MKRSLTCLLACALAAGGVLAQPVRNRILQRVSVREEREDHVVQVHFENPVRYLRHAPRGRGREIQVQLQHLALAPGEILPANLRESLPAPRDTGVPLAEIVYDGGAGTPVLEVRFTKSVDFDVRQGEDLRSISIRVRATARTPARPEARAGARVPPTARPELPPMPEAPDLDTIPIRIEDRFAIELETVAPGATPTAPPHHPLFERYRLYRIPVQSDDQVYYRYRLGFLPSKEAARQALEELRPAYPGAAIVPTSREERVASATRAVSAAALRNTATPSLPARREEPARAAASDPAGLLGRARAAMTGGDLDLAIRLLSAILDSNEDSPETRDALELLGLARERRGQLAHAKAEYEKYLTRYPEGDGAERVRQRLSAMLTRSEPARDQLRPARAEGPAWEMQTFGSLYSSYYRGDLVDDAIDEVISDSVAFTDLNLSTRLRRGDYDILARADGGYRYDIPFDSAIDEFRLGSLFVEAEDSGRGLEGAFGRQSANTGGVLGRFDGLRLAVSVLDGWKIGSVSGFPVDVSREPDLESDRIFTGLSLDTPRFLESIEGQVWALGQQTLGLWDRAAVGAELRYVAPSRFFAGFVDYDLHFGALNTALLIGNWSSSPDTSFNLTLDHRTTPVLTLQNALIGQPVDTLSDLDDAFTDSELEELALDRTARSSLAMLGVTHQLTESVQVGSDALVSHLGGTETSGGVLGTESTGIEYGLGVRLLIDGLFAERDVATAEVRAFAGDFMDTYTLRLGTRLPVTDALRIQPLILLRFDDRADGSRAFGVEPGIRGDLKVWKLHLDADLALQTRQRQAGADAGNEYGYRGQIGLRYDFD
jgi:hypothetical protein